LPTKSLLLDFETVPGSAEPLDAIEQYWPFGVHFRSIDAPYPGAQRKNGKTFAASYVCSYPTGFNIVADFDMPVYGASVDVGTAAGCTITMIARDRTGAILQSITSSPIPAYMEFVGSLSVHSDIPIASLEWWPSQNNAAVLIDNLHIAVPEPGALVMLALALACLTRRR
jgi:hypothetical protein